MGVRLKVQIPVEAGNKTAADGQLAKLIQSTLESLKPEAAYFFPEDGKRTAEIFFDLKDVAQGACQILAMSAGNSRSLTGFAHGLRPPLVAA